MRLRIDFFAIGRDGDLAAHASVDVRIRLACVIVVRTRSTINALAGRNCAFMPVPLVKRRCCTERTRAIRASLRLRIKQTIDGESIERKRKWVFGSNRLLKCERRCVIVIVIRASAMATEIIKFADRERIFASVVVRIEDRNTVRRQCDGAPA